MGWSETDPNDSLRIHRLDLLGYNEPRPNIKNDDCHMTIGLTPPD